MREKLIQIRLSVREAAMLDGLLKDAGCKTSEMIRRLIAGEYHKLNPPYKAGTPRMIHEKEPELTWEQKCEAIGGEVGERVNAKGCVYGLPDEPARHRFIPWDRIDEVYKIYGK
jgi:hypothetical protein